MTPRLQTLLGFNAGDPRSYQMNRQNVQNGVFQYQQLADTHISQTGYWEFYNVVLESSAMSLLDVQSSPDVKDWPGLESITIIDFSNADSIKANFADIQNLNSVISLNCSQPGCALDGVTIVIG